ncbi:fimbrial protein [Raoultella planticola]|uniref:fimbrial protein n=1 Tax=Raoultella planticola TaxID=575 RepID=UPI0010631B05|nr:fimbrial protein [Raoultella planticola]TDV02375.1 fimbrial protein [Raoultella planticola]TDX33528.1 fimbrial protein [Raoultella planticola]
MIRYIHSLCCIPWLFLASSSVIHAGDYATYSAKLNFGVEVALTCTLSFYTSQIDFGEVHKDDLSTSGVTRDIHLTFSGCNAENADISFTGNYISDDGGYLKNREGDGQASGVKITFHQNGNPVNLRQKIIKSSPREGDTVEFNATLESISGQKVKNGLIGTAIDITIAYR